MSNWREIKEIISGIMAQGYEMGRLKLLTEHEATYFEILNRDFIDNRVDVILSIFEEDKKQEATNE